MQFSMYEFQCLHIEDKISYQNFYSTIFKTYFYLSEVVNLFRLQAES